MTLAATEENVAKVIEILGPRLVVFGDILTLGGFFFTEDYDVIRRQQQNDREVAERHGGSYTDRIVSEEEKSWLCSWRDQFSSTGWTAKEIGEATKSFAAQEDVPFKSLIKVIRYAVSGMDSGPPLWETLELLGYWSVSERCDVVICGHCFSEPGFREAILRLRDGPRRSPVATFSDGQPALDWNKINEGIRQRNLEFKKGHPRYDYNVSLRPATPLQGPGSVQDGAKDQQDSGAERGRDSGQQDVQHSETLHRPARNKRNRHRKHREEVRLQGGQSLQEIIERELNPDKYTFIDINILPDDTGKPPKAD